MSVSSDLSGVFAPVLTPFRPDLSCDHGLFLRFCCWLQGQGAGLAIFGTNSEASSLSLEERIDLLQMLTEGGISPRLLLPGAGTCAIPDSVRLCRAAVKAGAAGVLMLPPFYYKAVSDEGLFAAFSEVIERVGDRKLKVLLYHIPQVSGVAISYGLIEQLLRKYPATVIGIKDSSGNFDNSRGMIERFPGFKVYSGSDALLLQTMRHGGAGCISATANVNPAAIVELQQYWQSTEADEMQHGLAAIRSIFEEFPMIAALKAATAQFGKAPSFGLVRPPLMPLRKAKADDLMQKLTSRGFTMRALATTLHESALASKV